MNTSHLTITQLVDKSPHDVFNAINDVRSWWSEEIDGNTKQLNDEFLYYYRDMHRARIRLTEVIPDKKIVWHVIENYFSFVSDTTEWTDTKIVFEIEPKEKQTQLTFTHIGLTPAFECYDVCEEAWTTYIMESLRNLITTGKGNPNPKEGGYNGELAEKWKLNA